MKILFLTIFSVGTAINVFAQAALNRVTTVVAKNYAVTNDVGAVSWVAGSATIEIPQGEFARVAAVNSFPGRGGYDLGFRKDGIFFWVYQPKEIGNGIFATPNDHVVEGPASFVISVPATTPNAAALLSIERWKMPKSR